MAISIRSQRSVGVFLTIIGFMAACGTPTPAPETKPMIEEKGEVEPPPVPTEPDEPFKPMRGIVTSDEREIVFAAGDRVEWWTLARGSRSRGWKLPSSLLVDDRPLILLSASHDGTLGFVREGTVSIIQTTGEDEGRVTSFGRGEANLGDEAISSLEFHPSEPLAVIAAMSGSVLVWDYERSVQLAQVALDSAMVEVRPGHIDGLNGTLVTLADLTPVSYLPPGDPPQAVAASPDGTHAAALWKDASGVATVSFYEVGASKLSWTQPLPGKFEDEEPTLEFREDARLAVSAGTGTSCFDFAGSPTACDGRRDTLVREKYGLPADEELVVDHRGQTGNVYTVVTDQGFEWAYATDEAVVGFNPRTRE